VTTWEQFAEQQPGMAADGARLLEYFGQGLGFIATVRKDGGPRVHPCCPTLAGGRLWVFVVKTSPKLQDLMRDGRYALHTFPLPPQGQDEEFYVSGRAGRSDDPAARKMVAEAARMGSHRVDDGYEAPDKEVLFELSIERALHTTWENWAQPGTRPIYTKWQAR
jgi:Pyridoxamine 5'-phosphate oxidase